MKTDQGLELLADTIQRETEEVNAASDLASWLPSAYARKIEHPHNHLEVESKRTKLEIIVEATQFIADLNDPSNTLSTLYACPCGCTKHTYSTKQRAFNQAKAKIQEALT